MKTSACLEVGRADFRDRTRIVTEQLRPAGPGDAVFVVERQILDQAGSPSDVHLVIPHPAVAG